MITNVVAWVLAGRRGRVVGALACIVLAPGCAGDGGTTAVETTIDTVDTTGTTGDTTTGVDPTLGTTTAATTSVSTSTTGGPPECAANPDYLCSKVDPCDEHECGDRDSRFDEIGCLRRRCSDAKPCPQGQVCHHPWLWGGCVADDLHCADDPETQLCVCEASDECSAAYCVPEGAFAPLLPSPPGATRAEDGCAPLARPAVEITVGLDAATCKGQPAAGGTLKIAVWDHTSPLAPGTYPLKDQGAVWYDPEGDGSPLGSDAGYLVLDSWSNGVVAGSYEVEVGGHRFIGAFDDAVYCPSAQLCP